MISLYELSLSFQGTLKLLRFDFSGLEMIDTSKTGARRSFWLALYLLPYSFLRVTQGEFAYDIATGMLVPFTLAWMVFYCMRWIMFPVLVMFVTRNFGATHPGGGIIAVSNWLSLPWVIFSALLWLLSPVISTELSGTVQLLAFIYLIIVLAACYGTLLKRGTLVSTGAMPVGRAWLLAVFLVIFEVYLSFTFVDLERASLKQFSPMDTVEITEEILEQIE